MAIIKYCYTCGGCVNSYLYTHHHQTVRHTHTHTHMTRTSRQRQIYTQVHTHTYWTDRLTDRQTDRQTDTHTHTHTHTYTHCASPTASRPVPLTRSVSPPPVTRVLSGTASPAERSVDAPRRRGTGGATGASRRARIYNKNRDELRDRASESPDMYLQQPPGFFLHVVCVVLPCTPTLLPDCLYPLHLSQQPRLLLPPLTVQPPFSLHKLRSPPLLLWTLYLDSPFLSSEHP